MHLVAKEDGEAIFVSLGEVRAGADGQGHQGRRDQSEEELAMVEHRGRGFFGVDVEQCEELELIAEHSYRVIDEQPELGARAVT